MDIEKITEIAIEALEDIKGEDIITMDTSKVSTLFSTMIVCSGNSTRQLAALADNVVEKFKQNNIPIINVEGKQGSEWVLVDCGEIIVHIMLKSIRSYYDLETLWSNTHQLNASKKDSS